MPGTYHIWTIQMAQRRLATAKGIELLDTTAKSGIKEFAPSFNEVMNYKNGRLSEQQYTLIYNTKMRESKASSPKVWKQLEEHHNVAVACYCPADCFCHRHIFVKEHMVPYLESKGHTVILEGEIRKKKAVIPFFGKQDMLSNWHPAPILVKGVVFPHIECFMMFCKAHLFKDVLTAELIRNEPDPARCKALGRQVKPFDDKVWKEKCRRYVFIGLLEKARQHKHIGDYLLSTEDAILVEASPFDGLWGAKVAASDPLINDPDAWPGLNWLGEEWMNARTALRKERESVVF